MDRATLTTWGLSEIAFAELGKIESATWEVQTLTKQGTFALTDPAPTLTPVYAEEKDEPLVTKTVKSGARQIEIDAPDLSSELATFLGGTVTTVGIGADQKKRYSFPGGVLKKMVRLKPTEGAEYIYITNGTVTHNLNGSLTKTGEDTLDVHLTIAINAGLGGTSFESEGLIVQEAAPTE